ncbi:MAG: hypothetical protein QOE45_1839 [Frankiaceae bacterium]|nr:hypothetical protein [Frankiaceae bacterium]
MTRRLLLLLAAAAAVVPAAPSHAIEIQAGAYAGWTARADASMCFTVSPGSVAAGSASAYGLVSTNTPAAPLPVTLPPGITFHASLPSTLISDYRPLLSTSGYSSICVGGAGVAATGGSVTFTLDLHSTTTDYVTVVQCSYSRTSAPNCG